MSGKPTSATADSAPATERSYHHGDLRAALVHAAGELLESGGIAVLSLRQVARAAGVSHAAPYRHFRDKHDLLEAVAAEGFRSLGERLDGIIARYPEDFRRQVLEGTRVYVEEVLARPHRAHLMFGGFLDRERRGEDLDAAEMSSFHRFVAIVKGGEAAGLYRPAPTKELVLTLWTATHGLAMLAAAGQLKPLYPETDPRDLTRRVAAHVLDGLLLRP